LDRHSHGSIRQLEWIKQVKGSGQPNCLKASLMNFVKLLGALLITVGVLGLIFGRHTSHVVHHM
jgi:hypothetical protein